MKDETYNELRERLGRMFARYFTFWEVNEPSLSPWSEDPDCGELRLIATLSRVAAHPQTPPAVLEMIAEELNADDFKG